MVNKRPTMQEMLSKKEKQANKVDLLEKDDFKALNKAAFSVFGPVLIGAIVVLALVILIFTRMFSS
ncbi:hypothetical protein [Dubosiella newyorkensis]|jgi:hypothetical protein|uniref:Uncharacterized protein n=1 Tax=Dubosiella newyorkensis TaxID=1862672 RepID=A0A1U7NPR2_9FIRM|nr:hypothetical protein [Dubosiella newyorkensis]MCI9040282.1 hypothetical protein [Dubosiella newyorkensis]OLU47625.1 hypothetical protein BO225_01920 [Dubosiella newyorkensis]